MSHPEAHHFPSVSQHIMTQQQPWRRWSGEGMVTDVYGDVSVSGCGRVCVELSVVYVSFVFVNFGCFES